MLLHTAGSGSAMVAWHTSTPGLQGFLGPGFRIWALRFRILAGSRIARVASLWRQGRSTLYHMVIGTYFHSTENQFLKGPKYLKMGYLGFLE